MKSNADLTKEIVQKAKAKRKKKRIVFSSITLCVCALLCFFVGYSNIIIIDFNPYENSYTDYLRAYTSSEEEVGFRFVDSQSAVVQVQGKTYPCSYEATSQKHFTLNVVQEEESPTTEEEPSIFYLEFWDTNAKLSWNILGTKIERLLSITEERNIPAGLWGVCATQSGNDGEIHEREEIGASWTLILENGDSYTGEGMDSAWETKFISIGKNLFQCMFDPVSGIILDASVFVYDETTFDYPVIRENYISDGNSNPFYTYSRLLSEEEKLDFYGGSFTASAIVQWAETEQIYKPDLIKDSAIKWRLSAKDFRLRAQIPVNATLDLEEDGSVKLKITGNSDYNGTFSGKWYALQHSVLVTLNKTSELVGNAFTIYVSGRNSSTTPTGEAIQQKGQSYIDSYDLYRTGYHTFKYYITNTQTEIYWGSEWTPDKLTPTVKYETEYVLTGEYYYEYFDGDPDVADSNYMSFDESFLQPLPINGQVTVVFHEDGTATITLANGSTQTRNFTENGDTVRFDREVDVYQGKNAVGRNPWYPNNVNKNCIVKLLRLEIGFTHLYREWGHSGSYVYTDENGKLVQLNYYTIYYRIYLTPKF